MVSKIYNVGVVIEVKIMNIHKFINEVGATFQVNSGVSVSANVGVFFFKFLEAFHFFLIVISGISDLEFC